ncbi:hypothetical protein [Mesorhizobium sp. M0633]
MFIARSAVQQLSPVYQQLCPQPGRTMEAKACRLDICDEYGLLRDNELFA